MLKLSSSQINCQRSLQIHVNKFRMNKNSICKRRKGRTERFLIVGDCGRTTSLQFPQILNFVTVPSPVAAPHIWNHAGGHLNQDCKSVTDPVMCCTIKLKLRTVFTVGSLITLNNMHCHVDDVTESNILNDNNS